MTYVPLKWGVVSWLHEMQLSNQIHRGHHKYGVDLFFELKLVSPFNSVESWLVKQPYVASKIFVTTTEFSSKGIFISKAIFIVLCPFSFDF